MSVNTYVQSATATGSADYEFLFSANCDGTLSIEDANGEVIVSDVEVKADTLVKPASVTLNKGKNAYKINFTPAEGYKPNGEYSAMESYETVVIDHTVTYKTFGEAGQSIWVAPDAKGSGSKEDPMSIYDAVKYVMPSQQIVLTEGTYKLESPLKIARGINGTADQMIYMVADPDAKTRPVIDFQGLCTGMTIGGDYWYFKGFDVTGSADGQKGLQVSGSHNTLDQIETYHNGNTGLQISRLNVTDTYAEWPSYNLILNCTSYGNADKGYEDADGFAAKLTVGDGNVFDGCIAHHNADDGWDLFAKSATGPIGVIIIRNCVSFGNGTLSNGVHYANGDMNGFKLGGSGVGTPHVVLNCLSFNNGATGFTDNNNPSGLTIMNATAWGNGKSAKKGNFLCYRASNKAVYVGLVSANAIDSDKFTGNMSDSIYYNTGKYYRLSGLLPTPVVSGDKKGTVVDNPSKVSGMFKNAVDFINLNGNVDKQLRNSDGTINMKGLYETQGSYSTLGAHFGVANQVISVTGKTSGEVKPTEKTTKATEKTTETTKATEKTTEATKATEKTTEATKATESKTDSTVSGTKLVLNANDVNTGKLKSTLTVDGFKIVAGSKATVTVDKSRKEYKGIDFTRRIKLSGKGSTSGRAIAFKTAGEAKVKVYATSSSTDESRLIKIVDKNGKDITSTSKIPGNSLKSVSFRVPVAGEYYLIAEDGGVNIYYVEVSNGVAY